MIHSGDTGLHFPETPERVIFRSEPYLRYRISFGENLYEIAEQHNTTVAVLCKINHLADPNHLMPGNFLMIPTEP